MFFERLDDEAFDEPSNQSGAAVITSGVVAPICFPKNLVKDAVSNLDEIVREPAGGAHVDHDTMVRALDGVLDAELTELSALPIDALLEARYQKFRNMGRLGREFFEQTA